MTEVTESYVTERGNMVRFNKTFDKWQLLYRPVNGFTVKGEGILGPMRFVRVESREDGVTIIDKMEADGNA